MPNWFSYGLMTLTGIALALFTFNRVRDRRLVAVYATMAGVTYLWEYVVLVLLNAYWYRPQVLHNEYFDSLIGAIVSDAVAIPVACMAVSAFDLGLAQMLLVDAGIVGTEVLFDRLGIYGHHWWSFAFTGAGLLVWFLTAKYLYRKLASELTPLLRFAVLVHTGLVVHASVVFVLVAFFGAYHYEIGWFQDRTRDHVAFATAYLCFLSLIHTELLVFGAGWPWRILILLAILPVDLLLMGQGILRLSDHWSLYHFLALRIGLLWFLDRFDRLFLHGSEERSPIYKS